RARPSTAGWCGPATGSPWWREAPWARPARPTWSRWRWCGDRGIGVPRDPARAESRAAPPPDRDHRRRDAPGRRRRPPARREQAGRARRALLANAAQHSPPDGVVEVAVGVEGAAARVEVLDSGPGIRPEDRERAFEKFVRLGRRSGGAGLGLFLARGLARSM